MPRPVGWILCLLCAQAFSAEPNDAASVAAPAPLPQAAPSAVDTSVVNNALGVSPKLFQLSARIDADYIAGNPVQQGFFVPSVRLAADGAVTDYLDYRLAFGEAREFTTVLLPTIIPVEAFINLHGDTPQGSGSPRWTWRFGMFTPWFNPWWTPDLSDLPIPDYAETHKELFISRDIGTQISYQPIPDRLEVAVGAFNGTGILGENTNNGRAFNAFVRGIFPVGLSRLQIGTGAYSFDQSSVGTVNYESNWIADVFMQFDLGYYDLSISFDAFYGQFQSANYGNTQPTGYTGTVILGLYDGFKLFSRGEYLSNPPTPTGVTRHGQIGPLWEVNRNLKVFMLFDYLQFGDGSVQATGFVRVRLVI